MAKQIRKTKAKAKSRKKAKARIDADKLWFMYRKMNEIRFFEENVWDVYTRGLMPGLAHLYIGEEGVAVGTCAALRDDDYITSTHRGHGHCLAKGGKLDRMMAEIMCFFGDGAANQGIMLETLNMAVIWDLPVIYVCENNQYGEHTSYRNVTGVEDIAQRAEGLGIEGVITDGSDVLEVYRTISTAVSKARRGNGPTLVEAKTYRFRGHHVGDGGHYRTNEEVRWWMDNKDPIKLLGDHMCKTRVAKQEELDVLQKQIEQEVLDAVEFGKDSPLPPPEQAYEDLYA